MENLKITGRIIKIEPVQQISEKFKKASFIVEIDGTYPKPHKFTITQNRVDQLNSFKENDSIEVYFNLEGREYKGNYYNDTVAWKVAKIGTGHASKPPVEHDDMPF